MGKLVIKSEKGLYCSNLELCPLITEGAFTHLTGWLSSAEGQASKGREAMERFCELVGEMPKHTSHYRIASPEIPKHIAKNAIGLQEAERFERERKSREQSMHRGATEFVFRARDVEQRVWARPQGWAAQSRESVVPPFEEEREMRWHWQLAGELHAVIARADRALRENGYPGIPEESIAGLSTIGKRSASFLIESPSSLDRARGTESFAVWSVEYEGYQCKDGAWRELKSAELYASEQAALRAIGARGLRSCLIAKVSLMPLEVAQRVGMGPQEPMGAFGALLAENEAKALEEALSKASAQMLRERLAQLEARLGQGDAAPSPAPKKARL